MKFVLGDVHAGSQEEGSISKSFGAFTISDPPVRWSDTMVHHAEERRQPAQMRRCNHAPRVGLFQDATLAEEMAANDAAAGSGGQDAGSDVSAGGTGGSAGTGGVGASAGSGGSAGAGGVDAASGSGGQDAGSDVSAGGTGGSSGTGGVGASAGSGGSAGAGGVAGSAGTVGTAGTAGAAGSGGNSGGCAVPPPANCPSASGGPTLVPVCGGYCIDSTEVTRDQYAAWLGTNPDPTAGQSSYCSWNTDFHANPSCLSGACQGAGCSNHPQVCVDWCDAYAYCKGVGKRLCGKIGGGANAKGDYANASKSQWFNACSANGANDYPYGDTYQEQKCNGDANSDLVLPVGSLSECQSSISGFAGVFDLSGNVWEWEDSCDDWSGKQDVCRFRGGSVGSSFSGDPFGYLRCGCLNGVYRFNDYTASIGFRCCSDP